MVLILVTSLRKPVLVLLILKALTIRVRIKPILYENEVKLLKFVSKPVYVFLRNVEVIQPLESLLILTSRKERQLSISFSRVNLILGC